MPRPFTHLCPARLAPQAALPRGTVGPSVVLACWAGRLLFFSSVVRTVTVSLLSSDTVVNVKVGA